MGAFSTPLQVTKYATGRWRLLNSLVYHADLTERTYVVPAGFVTDFASVPRLPLAYLLAGDTAHRAAVVHDYLYRYAIEPRKSADRVFCEAMADSGVPGWRRTLMYGAVRAFGGGAYDREADG